MPCLLCYEMSSTLLKLRRYAFHVSKYGGHVSQAYYPYFPQWPDGLQRCFSCCSQLILLCNGQNIAEYEVYWLMGAPKLILEAHANHSFLYMQWYAQINQLKLLKSKQTSIGKKIVIFHAIGFI